MNLGNRFSQHSFAQIPSVNIQRSNFDRSFAAKDTFNFDELTPCFVEEILPGDTINLSMKLFARLANQKFPIMDNMYIEVMWFFEPNRLTWQNWEKFNGAQDNPNDTTDYLVPYIEAPAGTGFEVGSVYDHFGIPTGIPGIRVNALPFRALNDIKNQWFRDQNLQTSFSVPKGDGPDTYSLYTITNSAKAHDYFTSCLPWPQKGDAIALPLGTSAPVFGHEQTNQRGHYWQGWDSITSTKSTGSININENDSAPDSVLFGFGGLATSNPVQGLRLGAEGDYASPTDISLYAPYADLSAATAATINQLRQAFMMQSLLELDARGGTRYVEILKAHFNVTSPDFRLQRPEFLGSSRTYISQHPIPQTSATTEDSPQGNLAAYSTAAQSGNAVGFSKSFVEHGYVIGIMRARADITYQQGINKMWSRRTRWDFFWPKLQELGEQAVLNKEIYAQGTSEDDETFGYIERYAEYRFRPSEIRGQFRSSFAESLDAWHLAEDFTSKPELDTIFIQSSTPIERALVTTEGYPHLKIDMWFDYKHARPIMSYGVPATLGRF